MMKSTHFIAVLILATISFVAFESCRSDINDKKQKKNMNSSHSPADTKNEKIDKFTKVVASVIIWNDNKILLLKRKSDFNELKYGKGLWDLPGGKVDFGEQMKETLQRELTEETVTFKLNDTLSFLDIISYIVQDSTRITHRINLVYSMDYSSVPQITLSEEHSEYKFTNSISEIGQLEMMQPVKDFVIAEVVKRAK